MEQLHDSDLAGHHRSAQRARGGHHPDKLPDLLRDDEHGEPREMPSASPKPDSPRRSSGQGNRGAAREVSPRENADGQQRLLDDGCEGFDG